MTLTERRYRLLLAVVAALAVAAYLFAWSPSIAGWAFPDPDDQMRLQEVRDFLAGQAWSDVSQHRMNAPWGAPMHWSRLIDLPLAAVMLALRPFGVMAAERGAVTMVPALTLVVALLLAAKLAQRLDDRLAGLLAAILLPLTTGAMLQLRPMRIDHHGWQMAIALGLTIALLDRDLRRGGRVAGALAALWLTISLEGLPFCAAAGGLVAGRWLLDPVRDEGRFAGFAGMLALVTTGLFAVTRDAAAWMTIACDAVSPVHLLMLGTAALGAWATRFARSLNVRLVMLAAIGTACLALYAGVAPVCTRGAFAALDPLTTKYWYGNVSEGLPVWRVAFATAVTAIGFPILGLVGAALHRRDATHRRRWTDYALLLLAATLIACCVQRAGAVANVLALPGGIALMRHALRRFDALPAGPIRVLANAATLTLLLPPAPALAAVAIQGLRTPPAPRSEAATCGTTHDFAATGALPPSNLLTNIDIGPGILFTTRHRVVASSHHRNIRGIHDALETFLGSPGQARAILRARRIDYLVACAGMVEMGIYAKAAPRGFWARLSHGERFPWATPVRLPGTTLSVWRIRG